MAMYRYFSRVEKVLRKYRDPLTVKSDIMIAKEKN